MKTNCEMAFSRTVYFLCAVILAMFLPSAMLTARAAAGTVSISTANSYTFSPASGNLVAGATPVSVVNGSAGAEGTGPATKLTDGAIIPAVAETYTIGNNSVLTYTLGESAAGYNVTGINIYSGWGDSGRENISISSIAYSTPAAPETFVAIPNTAVDYEGGTSTSVAHYTASGGPIAEQAAAIQITFGIQENNYVGYREIEIVGEQYASISTFDATDVTAVSATLHGNLVSTGAFETAVIAFWGESDGGTSSAWAYTNIMSAPQNPGPVSMQLSGLSTDTTYFFRLASSNESGLGWAAISKSFTTRGMPVINRGEVQSIGSTNVKVRATMFDDSALPTYAYIHWGTTDGGTVASLWDKSAKMGPIPQGTSFSSILTGMVPNTDYFWTVSASNTAGVAWSAAPSGSFRTWGPPALGASSLTTYSATSARFDAALADGGEAKLWVEARPTAGGATIVAGPGVVPVGGNHTINTAGLAPGTEYGWRAVASNEWGVASSPEAFFTTLASVPVRESAASGDWSDPATWNPVGVPVFGDEVAVLTGHTVTLTNSTEVLAAATVNVGGTLSFSGWDTLLNATSVDIYGTVTHVHNSATTTNSLGVWMPNARVNISCGTFNLAPTGQIDAKGKGFLGGVGIKEDGKGPGGGVYLANNEDRKMGAGHAAPGGRAFAPFGQAYGDPYAPTLPGSGGCGSSTVATGPGGNGGGAVRIAATGTATVDGTINANAFGRRTWYEASCGSGGSVFITCDVIAGSGRISADPESSNTGSGAGGAGGRIAVIYNTASQSAAAPAAVTFSAQCGFEAGNWAQPGGDIGTVYFPDGQIIARGPSTIKHAGQWMDGSLGLDRDSLTFDGANVRFMSPGFTLNVTNGLTVKGTDILRHKLELTNAVVNCGSILVNKAMLGLLGGRAGASELNCQGEMMVSNSAAFRVYAGITGSRETPGATVDVLGDLVISHSSWVYPHSHPTNGGSVKFTVGGLRIPTTDSGINATGLGYWGGRPQTFTEILLAADRFEGWGPGRGNNMTAAGHGGTGWGFTAVDGITCGSASMPIEPGSGGGYRERYIYGSNGGGAVNLTAAGDVIVEGSILADADQSAYHAGGGAGGSIYINCKRILGTTGLISAHGANRAAEGGAGGGGGRIAVVYDVAEQAAAPLPGIIFNAAGGNYHPPYEPITTLERASGQYYGEVGTLYFPDDQFLTRNTGAYRHSGSWEVPGLVSWSPGALVISNGWFKSPVSGFALTVDSLKIFGTDPTMYRLDLSNGVVRVAGDVTITQAGMRLYGGAPLAPDFQCGGGMTLANFARMHVRSSDAATFGQPKCGAYVTAAGDVLLTGGSQIWPYSAPTNGVSPFFEVANLTVADAASGFYATGFGYNPAPASGVPGFGPGHGLGRMGGGHGGKGGYATGLYGMTNDVATLPVEPGSGGGWGRGDPGGHGGGAIRIRAHGDVVNNGNFTTAGIENNYLGGAGSGGTIFIDCKTFSGSASGVMNANGPNGNVWGGAGGGGGRIAVWYGVPDEDRDRVAGGNMKRVGITTTHPDYLGTATVAGGFDGSGGKQLTTGGDPGSLVFLTVHPPAATIIIVR